jgi:serine/arginine repetitive matrix protein 2
MRRRTPSDPNMGYSDRAPRKPRRSNRAPSPVYYQTPNGNVPPLPPMPAMYQNFVPAVDRVPRDARRVKTYKKGSGSSSSTNMRADSDTPSSDLPQPPTPRDGLSISPPGNLTVRRPTTPVGGSSFSRSPLYYDYSEQFETEELVEYAEPVPTSFAKQLKSTTKDQELLILPAETGDVPDNIHAAEIERSELPGIAELEASPVGRRITKDLIREGLELMSTTGDIASFTRSPTADRGIGNIQESLNLVTTGTVEGLTMLSRPDETRHSILSQTGSSVLNSSTLEFAVRCSIPAMAGGDLAHDVEADSGSTNSPEKSTEDGMSELLAGYQHTDSKGEEQLGTGAQATPSPKPDAFSKPGSESNHAQKSSEVQSFKTCTDVPAPTSPDRSDNGDAKSLQPSNEVSPEPRPLVKNSDAGSFQIRDRSTAPGHPDPPSRLASSYLTDLDVRDKRPASQIPVSIPPSRKGRNIFGSSFSLNPNRFRDSSKPSIKQESISISDSSSSLNATPQPPLVPPRDSSASKEAQRLTAVGGFLLRHVVPSRFSRDKKAPSDEKLADVIRIDNTVGDRARQQEHDSTKLASVLKTPEKAVIKQDVVSGNLTSAQSTDEQTPRQSAEKNSPTKSLHVGITMVPLNHQHSFSNPVADIPGLSSALLLQRLSLNPSALGSPDESRASPEYRPRDSQTTTHLSWIGRKPFNNASASVSEPYLPLPSLREDTTTDLRLSEYRYNGPHGYLPDLKEESHEDSSLNTSASNLKHSQFRFPHGGGPAMQTSVEDAVLFSRSSTRSHRKSFVSEAHNLPRMEFSQANLMDKLRDAFGSDIRFSRSSDRSGEDKGTPRALAEVEEGDALKNRCKAEGATTKAQVTGMIDFAKLKRVYSPQKLKAEIDQLTIPSVTQLTQRFTELLPSLLLLGDSPIHTENGELLEFPEEEEIMEHAIEEIHHVHPPAQKRSSARLRPVRGSSALLVMEDDVFENITSKEAGGGVASEEGVGECGAAVDVGEALTRAPGKDINITHTPTRQLPPVAELQAPLPVATPPSSNVIHEQRCHKSLDSALSSTRSPRSFVSSPSVTDTRPWNFDKNYPWATTTRLSVDISLPHPAATKQSPRPGPSHLRNTLSDASTDSFTSLRTPAGSPTGDASSSKLNRQSQHLSIFGRTGDQAHAVGERYPTSALSPPTAIFRDHLSTDTSDDEDFTTSRKTKFSLRKRFSSAARNNTNTTPRATRSKVNPAELASPAPLPETSSSTLQDRAGEARAFTSNRHTFRDAEGMPTSAYHRRRFVESIKHWCRKGSHLIRTLSRRGN